MRNYSKNIDMTTHPNQSKHTNDTTLHINTLTYFIILHNYTAAYCPQLEYFGNHFTLIN